MTLYLCLYRRATPWNYAYLLSVRLIYWLNFSQIGPTIWNVWLENKWTKVAHFKMYVSRPDIRKVVQSSRVLIFCSLPSRMHVYHVTEWSWHVRQWRIITDVHVSKQPPSPRSDNTFLNNSILVPCSYQWLQILLGRVSLNVNIKFCAPLHNHTVITWIVIYDIQKIISLLVILNWNFIFDISVLLNKLVCKLTLTFCVTLRLL